jgi:hypothetical protein
MAALQQGDSAIIVNEHCDRIILNLQDAGAGEEEIVACRLKGTLASRRH